jgi:hypothetical protein
MNGSVLALQNLRLIDGVGQAVEVEGNGHSLVFSDVVFADNILMCDSA